MAVSTATMSFINGADLWIWALILFITRIGASMVEIMSETYFFKKVNSKNIDIIGFYRAARPIAYVVSPILASIYLKFFDVKYIFLLLGILMFFGLKYSLNIRDTK